MAKKVSLVCDLNPAHEATETLVIGLDDEFVEIDACEADAKKTRESLGKMLASGRPVSMKELAKKSNGGEVDYAAVKAWATANNKTFPAKGRLPGALIEEYLAANPTQ